MKFQKFYKDVSLIVFNLVVLFVIVNAVGFIGLQARDLLKAYGGSAVPNNPWVKRQKAYPDLKPDQVYKLFMETWEWRKYGYAPVSQFTENPYQGEYVNVSKAGFRHGGEKEELPWPPTSDAVNIFVFGGSTTFGYGLPDGETVPAVLSKMLNQDGGTKFRVYNFGRAFFHSSHEMLEFLRLAIDGHKPDFAVFIDGLNEFYYQQDDLIWTERLKRLVKKSKPPAWQTMLALGRKLPAYEFIDYLAKYFDGPQKNPAQRAAENVRRIATGGGPEVSGRIIDRYLATKSLIETLGRHYGIKTVFVWQPVPTYKYDLQHHLFVDKDMEGHLSTGNAYKVARERYDRGDFGGFVSWCADIQENLKKPLYVDAVHYNAELSKLLAGCILEKSGLRDMARKKF